MKNDKLHTDTSMVTVAISDNKCYDIVGNYFEDIWYKNVAIILINSFINDFKGQVCSEKLLVELAPLILGSFYGRKWMGMLLIHIIN